MIITRDDLINLARCVVNAMILSGPDNEDELHMLQVLLDPEADDDLEYTVNEARQYIDSEFDKLTEIIESMEDDHETKCN